MYLHHMHGDGDLRSTSFYFADGKSKIAKLLELKCRLSLFESSPRIVCFVMYMLLSTNIYVCMSCHLIFSLCSYVCLAHGTRRHNTGDCMCWCWIVRHAYGSVWLINRFVFVYADLRGSLLLLLCCVYFLRRSICMCGRYIGEKVTPSKAFRCVCYMFIVCIA